ncbi:MAG: hypothetical protein Ta2A_04960 [Treponemataceae bacterium]|nr:MAG: hypothetical protein Ta2A_04960 [Treponemataceae bacterium]
MDVALSRGLFCGIIKSMIVEYHEAAFKHKVSESDIEWALNTHIYEKPAADGSFYQLRRTDAPPPPARSLR